MKKTILALSVAVCTVLASCGGSGPESDAQKMCDMMKKAKELKDANNTEEIMKLMTDLEKLSKEMEDKYKDNEEAKKKIKEKVDACASDMMGDMNGETK